MSGTKISQFEGNICEIMWRAEAKSHVYERFFGYLKNIYNLNGPPAYTYQTPIFQTWSGLDSNSQLEEWEIKPANTDAEAESESDVEGRSSSRSLFSTAEQSIPPNRELSTPELEARQLHEKSSIEKAIDIMEMFASSEDEEVEAEKTICPQPSLASGDEQDFSVAGPSTRPLKKSKGKLSTGIEKAIIIDDDDEPSCSWVTTRRKRIGNKIFLIYGEL
ncbi:uncharacterized protein LOC111115171 [Crassostrea virginica]